MVILGIETSCDETSVAIVEGRNYFVEVKSNIVASSLAQHAKTGGIIPENAARAQLNFMLPVLTEALGDAFGFKANEIDINPPPIDAIAVTYGPGLIGPLLVGVETARTLSYVWKKPVVPVNHMMGHIYANFVRENSTLPEEILPSRKFSALASKERVYGADKTQDVKPDRKIEFPILALVVSGGHTDLIYMKRHGKFEVLGGTRDDAAGEAFDKIGRLLGLPYPAGPVIEKRARSGNDTIYKFPRPLLGEKTYDFSFSGLKTAVLREVKRNTYLDAQAINNIAAGTQGAIIDVLVKKTLRAGEEKNVNTILLSGGVAANQKLREVFQSEVSRLKNKVNLFYPSKNLCTDNAVMIASAAYFNYKAVDWRNLTVNPELYYE